MVDQTKTGRVNKTGLFVELKEKSQRVPLCFRLLKMCFTSVYSMCTVVVTHRKKYCLYDHRTPLKLEWDTTVTFYLKNKETTKKSPLYISNKGISTL